MTRLVWDIETNGLLDKLTTIHCIVTQNVDTREINTYHGKEIAAALQYIKGADEIIGHNILGFDIPAVQKLYPEWKPKGKVTDTLIMSQTVYPNLRERDYAKKAKVEKQNGEWTIPGFMMGRHGLEAWGHRLGFHKGDYAKEMKDQGLDPWAEFNEKMLDYCVNDVELNTKLYHMLADSGWSQECFDLEHEAWYICRAQEAHGCSFDEPAARELYAALNSEKWELEKKLKAAFGSWWVGKPFTPKRSHSGHGYIKDVPLTQVTLVEFNPASRAHIARRLQELRGWKPEKFTKEGQPQVDESTLKDLKYPEAKMLMRYLMLNKRIGQIAEGKEAWLKLVKPDGRIYGRINQLGAVTSRAAHSKPNLAQVPAVRSPFGPECRSFFRATPGAAFVGADASGLELRCLAHYLAHYDGGSYTDTVLSGDVHEANRVAAGLPDREGNDPSKASKPFIYALLYGAGDYLLGGGNVGKGKRLRKKFMSAIPAYARLVKGLERAVQKRGRIRSLDGRYLWIRHSHAALNTLLQGAGAVIMKQAMVNYHHILWDAGVPFNQVFWVHDEFQVECPPEYAETVGEAMVEGIRMVGDQFNLGCPLDGEYKIGLNWAETH